MANITAINPIAPVPSIGGLEKPGGSAESGKAFGTLFQDAVTQVEQYRIQAEDSVNRFMTGEAEEIHQVILAGQRAEIAFETFLQVRNEAVQAYQEVMRMQM